MKQMPPPVRWPLALSPDVEACLDEALLEMQAAITSLSGAKAFVVSLETKGWSAVFTTMRLLARERVRRGLTLSEISQYCSVKWYGLFELELGHAYNRKAAAHYVLAMMAQPELQVVRS